jgi:hypothetical protein
MWARVTAVRRALLLVASIGFRRAFFFIWRFELMIRRQFFHFSSALVGVLFLVMSQAQAQWTITTYKASPPNPPEITTMAIADQYFTGAFPSRFMGTSTVTHVNLFESGDPGQFPNTPPNSPQFPFPALDQNAGAGDTNDFVARITGTLVVAAANSYNFFTDSDDGNRFRLDLNQNGTFEDATESIVPDGGLQGAGNPADPANTNMPERSGDIMLNPGNYKFEISMFERGGGASIDAGYRRAGSPTQLAIGAPQLGISLMAPAEVKVVGAAVGSAYPQLTNFAIAEPLKTLPNQPGFPATGIFEVFNTVDTGGDGDFPNGSGLPGLGAPGANDDEDFLAVGRGILLVPTGGINNAVFRSNTDDGGRLRIDINRDGDFGDAGELVINDDVLSGPHNFDSAPVSLVAGQYAIEYSWFERGGGAEGEVSVRLSPTGVFTLLGDNAAAAAGTGLDVLLVPEPTTMALVVLCVLGLAGIRKRG